MKVFAIDQSYTCSGFVILRDGIVTHCEKFSTDKNKDIFERAWDVVERVVEISRDHNPDIIAMEGLAFGGKGNATRDLAGLQFTIVTRMRFVHGINVEIVAPGTVKKVATGKGNSPKELLLENLPKDVHKKFLDLGVKKTTGLLDLTDAYWIGRTVEEINRADLEK
jgi:Holliday junction resolvasome RuvABC endonuclease subunit